MVTPTLWVHYVPKTYFAAMAAGFHSVATGAAGPVTVTGRAWTTQTGSSYAAKPCNRQDWPASGRGCKRRA